jgi:hypothetical protein
MKGEDRLAGAPRIPAHLRISTRKCDHPCGAGGSLMVCGCTTVDSIIPSHLESGVDKVVYLVCPNLWGQVF